MRIALVDDHDLFREGLKALLSRDGSFEVIWEASNARDAQQFASRGPADVIVMDISMPGTSGIEATRGILKKDPAARVLVLTMDAREETVVEAFLAGATGYALKSQKVEELLEALRATSQGKLYLAPGIPRHALDRYNDRIRKVSKGVLDVLTPRERQVFELVVQNRSNRDIADELDVTIKTVETHRQAVNKKLGVHSGAELVRFAAVRGLIRE